jgi:arylsulfatase A-like enzyme
MDCRRAASAARAATGRALPDANPTADEQPGPVTLVLMAVGFGLVTGLLESLFLSSGWADDRTTELAKRLVNHHYLWMVPSAHLVVFGAWGLILGVLGRFWPKAAHRLAAYSLCGLLAVALLLLIPALHWLTYLLLAGGIAALAGPLVEAETRRLRLRPSCVIPGVAGVLVVLVVLSYGRDLVTEYRALARLPAATPGAPNVMLVVLDTVRADALGLYGYRRDTSPNLGRLAQRGVRFERANATSSWTLPSHSSMFTGRLPHELDVGLDRPLAPQYQTLAEALRARGYLTAGFVANHTFCHRDYGLARGFIHYEDLPVSIVEVLRSTRLGGRVLSYLDVIRFKVSDLWGDELLVRVFGDDPRICLAAPPVKNAARINRDALAWMSAQRERPFFAFLNYMDAHDPFVPPRTAEGRFGIKPTTPSDRAAIRDWPDSARADSHPAAIELARDCYDTCIAALDFQLGRLFDELQSRALLDNTVLIVTADHGEHFGGARAGLFGHGISLYPELIHVPLLVIAPGRVPTGQVISAPVSLRDLPATVVDLVGLGRGSLFPGESLSRLWDSGAPDHAAVGEPVLAEVEIETRPFADPERYWESVTIGDITYLRNAAGHYELYNTAVDPEAVHNLASSAGIGDLVERFRSTADRGFANSPARLTQHQSRGRFRDRL